MHTIPKPNGTAKTANFAQLRQLSAPQFAYTQVEDSQLVQICTANELALLAELYALDHTQPMLYVPDRGQWLHIHCRKDGGYVYNGLHNSDAVHQNIIQMLQIYQLGKLGRHIQDNLKVEAAR